MQIAVVGSGYVGLVAGTCLAETGNEVTCVDIDEKKIEDLRNGIIPIYEPGLEELVKRNVAEGRLLFTTDLAEAVAKAAVIFIAVGTPSGEDGSADLQYVLAVAAGIGQSMNGYKVVVNKSTVPVGTAAKVRAEIEKHTEHEFAVVSNPEFLKEGSALDDFLKPDRVVIGTDDERARSLMEEIYSPFVRTGNPIIFMDTPSAEMTKYAANAMLATRISFMNEIARICEKVGADVSRVREGIGTDTRIGHSFLFAGIGYGGSCFPKDVRAIMRTASENAYDFKILNAVEAVNEDQKSWAVGQVTDHFGEDLSGKHFGVWGLSFKPKTDDMREAPALTIIPALIERGATITAHDPEAMAEAHHHFGDAITYVDHPYDALDRADALLLLTEWQEFRRPNLDVMKERMAGDVIFDGRNVLPRHSMRDAGFTYIGVGVP